VITAVWDDGHLTVEGEVAEQRCAVLDREWAPRGTTTAVPALVLDALGDDAALLGAHALVAIAREAVGAATEDAVAVTGEGLVAFEARRLLQEQGRLARDDAQPPSSVIETTGDPAAVADATQRVRTMGAVVLAGEPAGRVGDLDFYPDVHRRGLRIVGVGRAVSSSPPPDRGELPDGLQRLRIGERLDQTARWYCVSG
jgi:hypothetical protein